jgi:hypothetical protein
MLASLEVELLGRSQRAVQRILIWETFVLTVEEEVVVDSSMERQDSNQYVFLPVHFGRRA